MQEYKIKYSAKEPVLAADWENRDWLEAETAGLENIRPESSNHHPKVEVKLFYHDNGISGIFHVEDKYLVCRHESPMDSVWLDSCVELFLQPGMGKGYFNFEFNCIGVLHASYIINPLRTENGFKEFTLFTKEDCFELKTVSSLKQSFEKEIEEPLNWVLQFHIPYKIIEKYAGVIGTGVKSGWMCNFNKCADESSHPHWITWAPVKELNFHAPESFGKLVFENKK